MITSATRAASVSMHHAVDVAQSKKENKMTNDELMTKADNIAKTFFYADNEGTLWPDFEGHSEAWINRQIEELEQTIYQSFKGK
jgi:hypothetical protein